MANALENFHACFLLGEIFWLSCSTPVFIRPGSIFCPWFPCHGAMALTLSWELELWKFYLPDLHGSWCHLEQSTSNLCTTSWAWNVGTWGAVCFILLNLWAAITKCSLFSDKDSPLPFLFSSTSSSCCCGNHCLKSHHFTLSFPTWCLVCYILSPGLKSSGLSGACIIINVDSEICGEDDDSPISAWEGSHAVPGPLHFGTKCCVAACWLSCRSVYCLYPPVSS